MDKAIFVDDQGYTLYTSNTDNPCFSFDFVVY